MQMCRAGTWTQVFQVYRNMLLTHPTIGSSWISASHIGARLPQPVIGWSSFLWSCAPCFLLLLYRQLPILTHFLFFWFHLIYSTYLQPPTLELSVSFPGSMETAIPASSPLFVLCALFCTVGLALQPHLPLLPVAPSLPPETFWGKSQNKNIEPQFRCFCWTFSPKSLLASSAVLLLLLPDSQPVIHV